MVNLHKSQNCYQLAIRFHDWLKKYLLSGMLAFEIENPSVVRSANNEPKATKA